MTVAKKHKPLDAQRQELCLKQPGMVYYRAKKHGPKFLDRADQDDINQEAWLASVIAASVWKPQDEKNPDAGFCGFRTEGIKLRFHMVRAKFAKRNMECGLEALAMRTEDGVFERDIPDTKSHTVDPKTGNLLAWWCYDEYAIQRRNIPVIVRVWMYLLYVECWTYRDIATVFGYTYQNIQQRVQQAVTQMAYIRHLKRETEVIP